jgi:hypothetical protein
LRVDRAPRRAPWRGPTSSRCSCDPAPLPPATPLGAATGAG